MLPSAHQQHPAGVGLTEAAEVSGSADADVQLRPGARADSLSSSHGKDLHEALELSHRLAYTQQNGLAAGPPAVSALWRSTAVKERREDLHVGQVEQRAEEVLQKRLDAERAHEGHLSKSLDAAGKPSSNLLFMKISENSTVSSNTKKEDAFFSSQARAEFARAAADLDAQYASRQNAKLKRQSRPSTRPPQAKQEDASHRLQAQREIEMMAAAMARSNENIVKQRSSSEQHPLTSKQDSGTEDKAVAATSNRRFTSWSGRVTGEPQHAEGAVAADSPEVRAAMARAAERRVPVAASQPEAIPASMREPATEPVQAWPEYRPQQAGFQPGIQFVHGQDDASQAAPVPLQQPVPQQVVPEPYLPASPALPAVPQPQMPQNSQQHFPAPPVPQPPQSQLAQPMPAARASPQPPAPRTEQAGAVPIPASHNRQSRSLPAPQMPAPVPTQRAPPPPLQQSMPSPPTLQSTPPISQQMQSQAQRQVLRPPLAQPPVQVPTGPQPAAAMPAHSATPAVARTPQLAPRSSVSAPTQPTQQRIQQGRADPTSPPYRQAQSGTAEPVVSRPGTSGMLPKVPTRVKDEKSVVPMTLPPSDSRDSARSLPQSPPVLSPPARQMDIVDIATSRRPSASGEHELELLKMEGLLKHRQANSKAHSPVRRSRQQMQPVAKANATLPVELHARATADAHRLAAPSQEASNLRLDVRHDAFAGLTYYKNVTNGETVAVQEPLPSNWTEHMANGKVFYYNPSSGVSQWQRPEAGRPSAQEVSTTGGRAPPDVDEGMRWRHRYRAVSVSVPIEQQRPGLRAGQYFRANEPVEALWKDGTGVWRWLKAKIMRVFPDGTYGITWSGDFSTSPTASLKNLFGPKTQQGRYDVVVRADQLRPVTVKPSPFSGLINPTLPDGAGGPIYAAATGDLPGRYQGVATRVPYFVDDIALKLQRTSTPTPRAFSEEVDDASARSQQAVPFRISDFPVVGRGFCAHAAYPGKAISGRQCGAVDSVVACMMACASSAGCVALTHAPSMKQSCWLYGVADALPGYISFSEGVEAPPTEQLVTDEGEVTATCYAFRRQAGSEQGGIAS
eukprot:TRINITY_DN39839_c0_g1_i2.p1 TRINITY_DN39839_c0_g1~~TRINITY_DN39839_c0_g1_i2.p1  ORF type:complete len:1075 (+),score=170.12 TRINITY_DN39839_c0_g1_i2:250-3474(+)